MMSSPLPLPLAMVALLPAAAVAAYHNTTITSPIMSVTVYMPQLGNHHHGGDPTDADDEYYYLSSRFEHAA